MERTLSKSEKKRRAKGIETLVMELVKLSPADIARLPCDEDIRREITATRNLKGGARKRQVKHITKRLRKNDAGGPLFTFLAENKGSKLKQNQEFHALERLRDDIVGEAIEACRAAESEDVPPPPDWRGEMIAAAAAMYAGIDQRALGRAAMRYARTRKPALKREVFRILKAAHERRRFEALEGGQGA